MERFDNQYEHTTNPHDQINSKLFKTLSDTIETNPDFIKINKEITDILKFSNENSEYSKIDKTNWLIKKLTTISNNEKYKWYLNVLYVLQLKYFNNIDTNDILNWISNVLKDTNIPYSIKINFICRVKENDFLVWNNLKQVELENELITLFPQYNWSNFQPTTTWEYTNIFA